MKNKIDYLIIILIISYIIFFILGVSVVDPSGYITGDSSSYLRIAGRVLEGYGFFMPSNGQINSTEKWFAIWPIGYPALISSVAWSLGLSTVIASKVVNIIFLILPIIALYISFGRNGLISSFILLTATPLRAYTMTWGEGPFLTAIIILCLYLGKILNEEIKINNKNIVILFTLLILPFLIRYIGLYVLGPAFLVGAFIFFKKRKNESILIMIAIFFALIFCLFYLAINFQLTGYITGMERLPSTESNFELFNFLVKAILQEFILIMPNWNSNSNLQNFVLIIWVLIALFCIILIKKNTGQIKDTKMNSTSIIFIIFAFVYLFALIYLRWNSKFEMFSSRLLMPSFSLFFIGICLWFLSRSKGNNTSFICLALISVSLLAGGYFYNLKSKYGLNKNYSIYIEQMKKKYSKLPDNAIVIFGSRQLKYLRPSIRIASPNPSHFKAFEGTWDEFLLSLDSDSPIFVEIGSQSLPNNNSLVSPDSLVPLDKYISNLS